MDFKHHASALAEIGRHATDALLLVVAPGWDAAGLDTAGATLVRAAMADGDLELKAGRTLYLHRPPGLGARRVVLAAAADASPRAFKAAVAAGLKLVRPTGAAAVSIALAAPAADGARLSEDHAAAAALAFGDALYVYRATKPSAPKPPALRRGLLLCEAGESAAVARGVARGAAVAAGVELAREWANRPGNHATPRHLGEAAQKLGRSHGLKVDVLDRRRIEKLGMGSFLAVSQGSEEPPRFIVMRYDGAPASQPPVVLVGKGITFDTGGISIKPAAEMDEMKFDMSGAASVLGTMRAVAQLKPRVNVVGLIAACENMPDGRAVKPGDVVTSLSGQTIEILNTDAEGRLILCDALTYAERLKPAAVVDIATLTGACVIALGAQHSGLFAPDDALADELLAAGRAAFDTCWRMPTDDEYAEGLKSNFADVANVAGRAGGAITAAKFLHRFAKAYPWAHLDIAGTAWKGGAEKGATGRPVGLLTQFVLARATATATAVGGRRRRAVAADAADAPAMPAATPTRRGRARAAQAPAEPAIRPVRRRAAAR